MRRKAEQDVKGKSIIVLMKIERISRVVIISDAKLLNKIVIVVLQTLR